MTSSEITSEQSRPVVPNEMAGEKEGLVSAAFLKWSTAILLAYFGIRLVYFALNISAFVPPDEVTHAGICTVFSKVFLLPDNAPETYEFGLVTNIPWLYYWTMGKLLHLNFVGLPDLVFLRLLNIPLAFGTVYFARRSLLLLTDDRLTQLLLVVAMTNTAMFSLMSASVSYDNLTNLFAAMAVCYLLAFFKKRSGSLLAAAFLVQLAGCLTKITFLPLVLVLNLLLVIHEARKLYSLPLLTHALVPHLRAACLVAYGGDPLRCGTEPHALCGKLSPLWGFDPLHANGAVPRDSYELPP